MTMILVVILLLPCLTSAEERNFQWKIPIGIINDSRDKLTFTGFYYNVQMLKQVRKPNDKFELITPTEYVDKTNSFQIAKAVCETMVNGVFALFGTKSCKSQGMLTSYSDKFHMPLLTVSSVLEAMPGRYEIHIKPPMTKVLRDILVANNWYNISYIYDSDTGLMRYQELRQYLTDKDPSFHIKVRRLLDIHNAHDDLRRIDKGMPKSAIRYILIDLENEESYDVLLKQIREVGMNKKDYVYILATQVITSMVSQDFLSLPMKRFTHGGVQIIGFQLVDYSKPKIKEFIKDWAEISKLVWAGGGRHSIQVGAALAYDAATILHYTLTQMVVNNADVFKTTFRRAEIYNYNTTKGVPCSMGRPWMHGKEIISRIKAIDFEGLTGHVVFDDNGVRQNFSIGVYKVALNYGPEKIGKWNSTAGYIPKGQDKKPNTEKNYFERDVRIVISVLEKPFFMLKTEPQKNGSNWTGNDIYEGFSVDLIREVARMTGFKYTLIHSQDGVYGVYDEKSQNWTGLMGLLINKTVDISIAPLTITKDRGEKVDFSEPFMNSGISVMIKIPDIQKPGVFAFMQPFSIFLWMCIVISYFVVSVAIFLVGRFSPSEWVWTKSYTSEYNKFTMASSFWFTMGSMMLQGSDTCPRSNAGRIVGGAWWFLVLICISSYTANLAAFLTIEKLLTPIEGVDDLIKQNEIAYGTLDSGSTQSFFKKSEVPVYKTMWNYMSTADPSVFVKSMEEGVNRVRSMKGKYAFLLESVYNEYFNYQDPCDTMQVGPNLNTKGYGIATPKSSDLRDKISIAILELKENGMLIKLKNQWWIEKGGCGVQEAHSKSKKRSLSLNKVAGVFFILIGGLVFAIVVGVVHFHKTKRRVQKLGGLFFFGNDLNRLNHPSIEYTRCPTETSNGRVVSNGRSNGAKPKAEPRGSKDLGIPELDHHVCSAVDDSLHRNRHEPVRRLNTRNSKK